MLRPFNETEVNEVGGAERKRRLDFNKTLSGTRIYIKHTFGMFKGRFPSLRDFGRHCDMREVEYFTLPLLSTWSPAESGGAPAELQRSIR